jgi:PAS domain S-box-containing protein
MRTNQNPAARITQPEGAEEMRARLAAIVESSDDAIISKTLEGIITSWNPAAERIFGYSAAETIGRPLLMLFPADQRDEEAKILTRLKHGDRTDHFETVRIRKDGRRIDVSVTISPLRDGAGNIIGASKIARDITDRKSSEAAAAHLASIVRTSDDAITDLGMPYVDGRKVASAVKAVSPSTPVILLTGWGQRLEAEDDVPADVDKLLSKPPRRRDLREALAACCKQSNSKQTNV